MSARASSQAVPLAHVVRLRAHTPRVDIERVATGSLRRLHRRQLHGRWLQAGALLSAGFMVCGGLAFVHRGSEDPQAPERLALASWRCAAPGDAELRLNPRGNGPAARAEFASSVDAGIDAPVADSAAPHRFAPTSEAALLAQGGLEAGVGSAEAGGAQDAQPEGARLARIGTPTTE